MRNFHCHCTPNLPLYAAIAFLSACTAAPLHSELSATRSEVAKPAPKSGDSTVVELDLRNAFKNPVGPRGLEPTPELLALAGRRVRLVGYIVREQDPIPGELKLSMRPLMLAEREDGPADDLPAATVFVHLPLAQSMRFVSNSPQPLSITGTLSIGNLQEPDGRISYLRLFVDLFPRET